MFNRLDLTNSKTALALSWYLTSVFAFIFASFLLVYSSFPQKASASTNLYQSYKALPSSAGDDNTLGINIDMADARVLIVDNFFKQKKSPLSGLGEEFVKIADMYGLDFRLLPAIAMQESNGGKILPKDSFNPFGYGVYGGKVMRFSSFAEAIERVGRGIKKDYLDFGLITPYEIMPKYTPPSIQKGGAWAIGVSAFMEQLR